MSRSVNGQPEVIVNYADGFAYSKGKMEEAFRAGGLLATPSAELAKPKKQIQGPNVKKDDVDLIVAEFEIPRAQAEKLLSENGGDVQKAMAKLIYP